MTEDDPGGDWYLSFDCATKSFAWALVRVADGADVRARLKRLPDLIEEARRIVSGRLSLSDTALDECEGAVAAVQVALGEAQAAAADLVRVVAGGADDLVPGKKDKEIHGVERIRALKRYLDTVVIPATRAAGPGVGPGLHVAVEFQMGANFHARAVATALVTVFSECDVFFVGPALKNRITVSSRPDLRHALFIENHSSSYAANKAHAKALLGFFETQFPHSPDLKIPRALRKDFADCLLQILAFRQFGPVHLAAEHF